MLPNLKMFDEGILTPLREKGEASHFEYEALVGGIMKAIETLVEGILLPNVADVEELEREGQLVIEFLGRTIGERVARLGNQHLNRGILEVRHLE